MFVCPSCLGQVLKLSSQATYGKAHLTSNTYGAVKTRSLQEQKSQFAFEASRENTAVYKGLLHTLQLHCKVELLRIHLLPCICWAFVTGISHM